MVSRSTFSIPRSMYQAQPRRLKARGAWAVLVINYGVPRPSSQRFQAEEHTRRAAGHEVHVDVGRQGLTLQVQRQDLAAPRHVRQAHLPE